MLFSEPKIPQLQNLSTHAVTQMHQFQCSSASRKFLNVHGLNERTLVPPMFQCSSASRKFLNQYVELLRFAWLVRFQCSSASRKFLNWPLPCPSYPTVTVSVLFSEPKIPQPKRLKQPYRDLAGFSALQRAENSSTEMGQAMRDAGGGFSALQRAENSSTPLVDAPERADRKSFSALQRAENSSTSIPNVASTSPSRFQCSSASRKFLNTSLTSQHARPVRVSVLFSEPKIPQPRQWRLDIISSTRFQCSSASRKFLNRCGARRVVASGVGFSALQRAENSSTPPRRRWAQR